MMELFGVKFTGKFADEIEAARKRNEARAAEIGSEEYERQREEERQKVLWDGYVNGLVRTAKRVVGDRFRDATFGNFGVNDNNREAYEKCMALVKDFSPDKRGIMLTGNNGIGKNHLAAATHIALAGQGIHTYYNNITGIKNTICDNFEEDGVEDAVRRIINAQFIVINDLGAESDTKFAKELMFHLVDRIYEARRVLMITTNILDGDELESRYDRRVISRILGMCDPVCYEDYDHRIVGNVG